MTRIVAQKILVLLIIPLKKILLIIFQEFERKYRKGNFIDNPFEENFIDNISRIERKCFKGNFIDNTFKEKSIDNIS